MHRDICDSWKILRGEKVEAFAHEWERMELLILGKKTTEWEGWFGWCKRNGREVALSWVKKWQGKGCFGKRRWQWKVWLSAGRKERERQVR